MISQIEQTQSPVNIIESSQPHQTIRPYPQSQNNTQNNIRKRKKKHHKKKMHRDPEQIKQIKLLKLNVKKEQNWNNRFAFNITQYQYSLNKNKIKKLSNQKLKNQPIKTAYIKHNQIIKPKLPNLTLKDQFQQKKQNQKKQKSKHNNKSFNVRAISKKSSRQQVKQTLEKKQDIVIKEQQKKQQKIKSTKRLSSKINTLLIKLQQKKKSHKINEDYNNFLLELINSIGSKKSKQLYESIQKQIETIGKQQNLFNSIEKMINKRKQSILQIKQNKQNIDYQYLFNFQTNSLNLVEQILKYKLKWQQVVKKCNISKQIPFIYDTKPYLQNMNRDTTVINQNGQIDPFLVKKISKFQQYQQFLKRKNNDKTIKQRILKLRACQLLLIEQQLSNQSTQ